MQSRSMKCPILSFTISKMVIGRSFEIKMATPRAFDSPCKKPPYHPSIAAKDFLYLTMSDILEVKITPYLLT